MPSDVRDALKRGAPRPDSGPDIDAILRGGRRLRARRRIAFAAATAAVIAGAALVAPNLDSLLATEEHIPPAGDDDRPSVPPAPKANGKIAFVRSVPIPGEPAADYDTTLYFVAPGGGGPEPVLEGVWYRTTPMWSPDGTRLAVMVAGDLVILDQTGAELQRTQWCTDCSPPTWSPDGTRLLFTGRRQGEEGLWTVRVDGSELRLLRAGNFEGRTAHWSPDGGLVAIASSVEDADAPYDQIRLLDVEGGDDPAAIVPNAPGYRERFGYIEGFGWAPDGRSVALAVGMDGDRGGIYVADIETGEQRLVASCAGEMCRDIAPTFSPDGEEIVFARSSGQEPGSDGFTGDVMVVDAAGGEPRLITGREGLDCCTAWQPLPSDAE